MKIIISGGGTAGHIYPAIATAQVLKERYGAEILFVGATSRMEMQKVPLAGFEIVGLPVEGLKRKITHKNLIVLTKFIYSLFLAYRLVRKWRPDAVVGFGGYASAPVIRVAQRFSIPTVLQEQNSYPGIANRLHSKYARVICTAYDGMERFFPGVRIVKTGNPLRVKFDGAFDEGKRKEAYSHFGLKEGVRTVLVTGGSLGARSINSALEQFVIDNPVPAVPFQIIWQTGSYYWEKESNFFKEQPQTNVHISMVSFIDRMDLAYAVADVMVCRAGASTISEIQLLGTPAVFVPSPNVAEDHQTHNAEALVNNGAAMMIADSQLSENFYPVISELIADDNRRALLSENVKKMGIPDSAERVAELVVEQISSERTSKSGLTPDARS